MTISMRILKFLGSFFKYASLILASLIAIIPMASAVITAFKSEAEYKAT